VEPQEYDESMRQLARMLGKMPEPHYGMAELPQAVRALAKRYAALRAQLKRDMHRGQQPPGEHAERRPTAKRRRPWP